MTHSLHRLGTVESLENDFVFLITPAAGINDRGALDKLLEVLDYIEDLGPDNIGDFFSGTVHAGHSFDDIRAGLKRAQVPRIRCCFDDAQKVRKLLGFVKDKDYGLSVTVSGLVDSIRTMTDELSIEPHSINLSMGVYGRTDRLPVSSHVMEIVSMCGHGMISPQLVESLVSDIASGRLSPEDAAKSLAHPCICGIFNTQRAAHILRDAVEKANG